MAEFIDRSKLKFDFRKCNGADSNWTPQRVMQMIHRQPPVDVEPVRYGRWIFVDNDGYWYNECSVCGGRTENHDGSPPDSNYYPNCGARMDNA